MVKSTVLKFASFQWSTYRKSNRPSLANCVAMWPLTVTASSRWLVLLSAWILTDKSSTSGLLSVRIGTAKPRYRLCIHIPHYPHPNPSLTLNLTLTPNLTLISSYLTNKHQYAQPNMPAKFRQLNDVKATRPISSSV